MPAEFVMRSIIAIKHTMYLVNCSAAVGSTYIAVRSEEVRQQEQTIALSIHPQLLQRHNLSRCTVAGFVCQATQLYCSHCWLYY